ncbi:MAG: type II toxin-antitoxin system RelE/ParE family toxin [Deltaproteobacteria bacterium]|nr:type II toxin-antitoxin system RelE/ParE family toxin [Deltaproteobacteria bacterium]
MIIKKFQTERGDIPFDDWINRIDVRAQIRVARCLDRIERGNFGDHKGVGQGVTELRVDYGPGYRVYFGRDGKEIVVLLGGGTKRGQHADIEQAQRNWKRYKQEKRHARRAIQDK